MTDVIHVKKYKLPPVNFGEVLRYAGCRKEKAEVLEMAYWADEKTKYILRPAVCWRKLPVRVDGKNIDLGGMRLFSGALAENIGSCQSAILFAATIGLEIDRWIGRYGRLSPAKGLLLQALGAERIETLCDVFNKEIAEKYGSTRPRFSPGYGDFPMETQRKIFDLLDCSGKIGLYLNESLLMSPTKSVTAVIGIGTGKELQKGCVSCGKKDCTFRR